MKSKKTVGTVIKTKPVLGFIGQGFVGKAYADDFEKRGFKTVRFALEEPYRGNKEKIKDCDMVFIAVPTPTTEKGFDDSIIRGAVKLVGKGKTVVIKSTILPGTTASIQKENPDIFVFHSPEFLREVSAGHDAGNPERNIIGMPIASNKFRESAEKILSVLPKAKFELITGAEEAELVKYAGNCFFYFKIIFANLFYEVAKIRNIDWEEVSKAVSADSRIGPSHMNPVHQSGRGAGGHCFIKDFSAFSQWYGESVEDKFGKKVLESLEQKNIDLLLKSGKDIGLLKGVYGELLKGFKNDNV